MVRLRVRVRFCKQGDLRLIGHLDLMRCLERLFRRAELRLSFSEGYHPKPRMTFPLALAVGIEGDDEVMEFELAEQISGEELLRRIRPQAPAGLEFLAAEALPEGSKKASVHHVSYEATIPASDRAGLAERIERLLSTTSCKVERGHGRAAIDVRPRLAELTLGEESLRMRLQVDNRGSVGPREVLTALGLTGIERRGCRLRRTAVEICA